MTRSFLWNFTDAADYALYNCSVTGGMGQLSSVNETVIENTSAQFILGTGTNVDTQVAQDAMVINDTSLAVQTLTLQPGPEGLDNYLYEWFAGYSPDTEDLRLNGEYDPVPSSSHRARIIMQFDLSTVPAGATIEDATLWLYEKPSKPATIYYSIHAVNHSWDEQSASWNNGWLSAGGDFSTESFLNGTVDGTNGWHSFDLSRLVDLWTRGSVPNYGFIIVPRNDAADGTKDFTCSDVSNKPEQRPKLIVNYTLGEAGGMYESQPIGPGTNSTFTLASWTDGFISKATDEFSTGTISSKWNWTIDPTLAGGSVNFDHPGWLNVTGSQPTLLTNASIGCNYLYQTIRGNFRAETSLQEHFATVCMGAGLQVKSDDMTWLALYKGGIQASGTIDAKVCKGGYTTALGSVPWTDSNAFLRIDRTNGTYQLLASANGTTWIVVASYTPQYDFGQDCSVGLFVFSGDFPANPVVEFDYCRIEPVEQTGVLELSARTGNSTSLVDPSWGSWSAPLGPGTGAVLGAPGRYIQYRVTMNTTSSWLSPMFSGFDCHYERFAADGTITTGVMTPPAFQTWESMTVSQWLAAGAIEYLYSTDNGTSWTSLGYGTSFALPVPVQTLMIRAAFTTQDTAVTPSIFMMEVVYRITHACFYVSATPATIEAGEPFTVYIEPKDTSNNTAAWEGQVTLHAVNAIDMSDASSELNQTLATVPASGQLTISDMRYTAAETIRILVSGGGSSGISGPIVIVPGPIDSLVVEPDVTTLVQNSSTVFTADVCDAFGNAITGITINWYADASLGILNVTTGNSVTLTTGLMDTGGFLNVTALSMVVSRFITVTSIMFQPQIDPDIPIQSQLEDFGSWSLDIGPYVFDNEDNDTELKWYTTNETVVTVVGDNRTGNLVITFSTIPNVAGINVIDLWVVDSDRMTGKGTITVDITPVNDPPKIAPIDPLTVKFNDPYIYDLKYYVEDVEAPPQVLTLSVDAGSTPYVTVNDLWLTFTYPESMNGTQQTVVVTVTDGIYASSTVLLVNVTDDIVPRVIGNLPNIVMNQGDVWIGAFDLDNYFTDPDGDILFYAHGNTHVGVTIQPNHTVDFYAPTNWAGDEHTVFKADDSKGARAESALTATIIAVNQPPSISPLPDLVVRFGQQYSFDLGPYIRDLDDDLSELLVTTNESHTWIDGLFLNMEFPAGMTGMRVSVNITVSDGEQYDWWAINVTISMDYPPEILTFLPEHSFLEDTPISYPVVGNLQIFFKDNDSDPLTFTAFTSTTNVTAQAIVVDGNWSVTFISDQDWNGFANLTIRATDPAGALVETTVSLIVVSVPDKPTLSLPDSFTVVQGTHAILDISKNVADPDSSSSDMRFDLSSEYAYLISIHNGIIVFEIPEGFLDDGEKSRDIEITVSVFDQDNLMSTDTMTITITKTLVVQHSDPLLWLGLAAFGIAAALMAVFAISRRKKPFVVQDMMLVHNDGFLIGRLASHAHVDGEIDQDILSGMLTAVLNFVEDSMSKSQESLKTFGFKDYQVLVRRGTKTFAAIVYEGDMPKDIEKTLAEFITTFERVYKKKIMSWTGDIETDFAGVEVLIQGFVKEHSKKNSKKTGGLWTPKIGAGKGAEK